MSFRFEVKPSNPGLGTTATVSWEHTSGWSRKYKFGVRFTLIKPNGEQVQVFPSSGRYEYVLYPRKTKTGSFNFTVPDLPGKYTLIGIVDLYYRKWVEDERASYSWIVSRPEACSAKDFIDSLASHYSTRTPEFDVRRKIISWYDFDTPLGIDRWGSYAADAEYNRGTKIRYRLDLVEVADAIEFGYDPPRERKEGEIFKGWVEGYEMLKMYCSKDGKWYWVKVPCEVEILAGEEKTNIATISVSKNGVATIKVQYGSYKCLHGTLEHIYLFVDGKEYMHWDLDKLAEKEGYSSATRWWYGHNETFVTKVQLPGGLHHVALVPCSGLKECPWSTTCKWVKVEAPPIAKIQGIKVNGESVGNGGSRTISTPDVTVKVGVSNTGGKGDIVAHITIKDSGGKEVYSTTQTVGLSTGETKEVTFGTTLTKVDTYRVTVSVGH